MARVLAVTLALIAGCGDNLPGTPVDAAIDAVPACTPVPGTAVTVRQVVHGCGLAGAPEPPGCMQGIVTLVTSPRDDARLFALELDGRIRILQDEQLRPQPFLDLSQDLGFISGGELGLLGLAFHPAYAQNRQFFVYYTVQNPDTSDAAHPYLDLVVRYTTSATHPDVADPASRLVVLAIRDPYSNHQGGMIEFGRDGYLYISTGDGGSDASVPADPLGHAQNPRSLLGKVLRIDVDRTEGGAPYGIPSTNPFATGTAGAPEVWMLGMRNPWRWSFDRETGDMWLADVGAATREEINVLSPAEQPGANLGWKMWEGTHCYEGPCDPTGMTFPAYEHDHAEGFASIIGGEVYRGRCYPDLVGTYFYTDTYDQHLMSARRQLDGSLAVTEWEFLGLPTSLYGDARGELYITTVGGDIFQLVVAP